MPQGDPLFIFRLTPVVLSLLGLPRADALKLLASAGLPESALLGTITAPLSRVRELLAEASLRHAGPQPLAIDLALAAPEGTYDTAELLVRTAPSLARGLDALARYGALINPVGRFEVRSRRGLLELHYFVPGSPDALGPELNEFTIAYVVRALGRLTTTKLTPRKVWFPHRAAEGPLGAYFQCPIEGGASTCGFAIDGALSEAPLRTADPIVFDYLVRQATQRMEALGARSFAAVVVDAIEQRVGFAGADLPRVAKALGLTARTAQRRLESEGTTFREVLEGARKRRAEALLAAGTPVADLVELLGFADQRSVRRALKRWG